MISDELQAGIRRHDARIAAAGGYGATVCAMTEGSQPTEVIGVLIEAGFGECQPAVRTPDGRRWRVQSDSLRAAA